MTAPVTGAGWSAADEAFMGAALAAAAGRLGRTAPNPTVGCAIVQACDIVGLAATGAGGRPHAEDQALAAAGPRAEGADVFVTLEPCARRSDASARSCTQLLLEARVRRVVIAAPDPHVLAGGEGVLRLRAGGVIVEEGLLAEAAIRLNVGFFTVVRLGRPFVAVDGDASRYDGDFELGFRESFEEALARMARNGLTRVRVAPGTPLAAALADRGLIDHDATGPQLHGPVRR